MSEKTENQQPILLYPQYPIQEDNEINLFDIWRALSLRKNLIITITLLTFLLSIAVALLMPKVWQSEIRFMPTLSSNILGLNDYTPASLYQMFFVNFNSTSQRKAFFIENKLIDLYQDNLSNEAKLKNIQIIKAFEKFNNDLTVKIPKKNVKNQYTIATLRFSDQKLTSELLNKYSQLIHDYTLKLILNEIEKSYSYQLATIKSNISLLQQFDKQLLKDKIIILDEAIHAAELLGIEDAKLETLNNEANQTSLTNLSNLTNQAKLASISNFLYLRGYKALEVEKKMLLKRKDNYAFISGMRALEEKSIRLHENLNRILKTKDFYKIIRIDQGAIVPITPIKPKKKLIVILGTIVGFFISLIVVLFLNIRQKYIKSYNV